jgi:hypothetical protein
MTLSDKEFKDYIEAHLDFLFYVGRKTKILEESVDFRAFKKLGTRIKFKCREEFLSNPGLLNNYLEQELETLETEKIKILEGFKKRISGDFVILKYLKDYAVLIDLKKSKVYLVKALGDKFQELISEIPKMVKTTILPFKDKIIYDGFLEPYGITIGQGIRRDLNRLYKKAKDSKELIAVIG